MTMVRASLHRHPSRRTLFTTGAAALGVATLLRRARVLSPASAEGRFGQRRHGISIFGDLKYGPDFTHFDYVTLDAPRGGEFATQI